MHILMVTKPRLPVLQLLVVQKDWSTIQNKVKCFVLTLYRDGHAMESCGILWPVPQFRSIVSFGVMDSPSQLVLQADYYWSVD